LVNLRATLFLLRNVPLTATLSREGRGRTSVLLLALLLLANTANGETLKNHYNDPFVQVTSGVAACPQPRGPFMTAKEAQAEAHPRIERGTTCFRAGKCIEPNSYRYDARIAQAAQAAARGAVRKTPSLAGSSVWITVQRRFIFVHGCVTDAAQISRWERVFRQVPEVEYVAVDLAVTKVGRLPSRVPYPVMPSP
jgi:hypothetical protein